MAEAREVSHRDIEDVDSLADERRPDCPECHDVFSDVRHACGCHHRRGR